MLCGRPRGDFVDVGIFSAHVELAELFVRRFCLFCHCDLIVVVEQVSQHKVQGPWAATVHGSSVFFGGSKGVAEWDTETGVVTKVAEHTGEFPWFRHTTWSPLLVATCFVSRSFIER